MYCLDSDVIIWHLRKGTRQSEITAYLKTLAQSGPLACSVMTVAEVEQGARPNEFTKTRALLRGLACYPVGREVAERAGEIVRDHRAQGRTILLFDALIGATCIENNLTLVTLNVRDFNKMAGLAIQVVP